MYEGSNYYDCCISCRYCKVVKIDAGHGYCVNPNSRSYYKKYFNTQQVDLIDSCGEYVKSNEDGRKVWDSKNDRYIWFSDTTEPKRYSASIDLEKILTEKPAGDKSIGITDLFAGETRCDD